MCPYAHKFLLERETHLQIHVSSFIRVISHPFLPTTSPNHLLEEGVQPQDSSGPLTKPMCNLELHGMISGWEFIL